MNKMLAFASRNLKEIIRDKLNLAFGLGFPVVLLLLLTAIQSNVPVELFAISSLAPGVAVFGLSFISLFSGMLIAKDRGTSFMLRLYTSPMSAAGFICGYLLPLFPVAAGQICATFLCSVALGLAPTWNLLLTFAVTLPSAVLFIAIGLLCGTVFNEKQVGGICGALLTNLSAWLSGTWFDLALVGGVFEKLARVLPFAHAVDAGRAALSGNYGDILPHLWIVAAYAVGLMTVAVVLFTRKMKSE